MKLTIENGSFGYPHGDRQVLKNINVTVDSGEILAILGPNGAGKTTMLRCLMGLLRWDQGRSTLDGRDIHTIPYRELWRDVSYVPQARQVSAAYTIEEMVLLGRSSRIGRFARPGVADLKKTEELLELLHLTAIRRKRCSEISGGELQMVLIARALASEPQVLILDEPESNLDFRNQLLVLDTMSNLAAQGMTCVFNTHYPAHALRRAGKALLLSADGTYLTGATRKVVTEDSISRIFGVQTVIGSIETPGNIYQDVVPVSIRKTGSVCTDDNETDDKTGTAGISRETAMKPDNADHGNVVPRGEQPPATELQIDGSAASGEKPVIAGVTIITPTRSESEQINEILHSYQSSIIGRMGMPYPRAGLYIINLTLDAPVSQVQALTDRLNLLPDVSVKATYAKECEN